MVPPPASMIKACSPGYKRVKKIALGRDSVTDLQVFTRLGMGSAKAKTCFTLGNKVDGGVAGRGIGDNTGFDCGVSQVSLLRASPSVGMGQHQLDGFRDRVPSEFSIWLRGFEQRLGRIKEIAHKICENVDNCFPPWELRAHLIHQRSGEL